MYTKKTGRWIGRCWMDSPVSRILAGGPSGSSTRIGVWSFIDACCDESQCFLLLMLFPERLYFTPVAAMSEIDSTGRGGASVTSRRIGDNSPSSNDWSPPLKTPRTSHCTGLRRQVPSAMNLGTGKEPAKDEEIPSPFPEGRLTLAGLGARQIRSSEQ